jgi:hypothetical protein
MGEPTWSAAASGTPGVPPPTETDVQVADWPKLHMRTLRVPGDFAGWCSESELITCQQPNRVWKINVDTGQQTLLFPPERREAPTP